ncbi:hypothetical protein ScPMuIL_002878 [Solemya velum]
MGVSAAGPCLCSMSMETPAMTSTPVPSDTDDNSKDDERVRPQQDTTWYPSLENLMIATQKLLESYSTSNHPKCLGQTPGRLYCQDKGHWEIARPWGGDGRCDSPEHSAKFGSYSMLELDLKIVIDVQHVQFNEVKSSNHMEKEGLEKSVEHLHQFGLSIETMVTDRHLQVNKWIRKQMPGTTHYFGVWKVSKGQFGLWYKSM